MRPLILPALLALLAAGAVAPPAARAELILVDGQVALRQADVPTPTRGMTHAQRRGALRRARDPRAAVGQPPITRWDYPGFSVYFEHDRVLHTVVRGS